MVNFASQTHGGLAASCQHVFMPSEATFPEDPSEAAPPRVDTFSYDGLSECDSLMEQDPSPDEGVGSQNKRRRTAGVHVQFLLICLIFIFNRTNLSLIGWNIKRCSFSKCFFTMDEVTVSCLPPAVSVASIPAYTAVGTVFCPHYLVRHVSFKLTLTHRCIVLK